MVVVLVVLVVILVYVVVVVVVVAIVVVVFVGGQRDVYYISHCVTLEYNAHYMWHVWQN